MQVFDRRLLKNVLEARETMGILIRTELVYSSINRPGNSKVFHGTILHAYHIEGRLTSLNLSCQASAASNSAAPCA